MFKQLAAATDNTALVIFVMLAVMAAFGVIVWRVVRKSDRETEHQAHLPLEGDPPQEDAAAPEGDESQNNDNPGDRA